MNWGNPNTLGSPNSLQSSTLKFAQLSLGNLTREKPNIWQVLWFCVLPLQCSFPHWIYQSDRNELVLVCFGDFCLPAQLLEAIQLRRMEAKLKTNQFWSVLPSSRCWFWKRLGGGAWPNFPGDWWVIPFWVTQRYLAKTRGGTILEPCSWEKKNLHCPYTKNLDTWFIEHTLLPLVGGRWGGWLDHVGSGHVNLSCQIQDKRNLLKFSGRLKLLVC